MSDKDDSVEMSEGIITADSGSVVENKDTQTQENNAPQVTDDNPAVVEENADQDAMGQLKSKLKKLKEKKKEEEDADNEIVEGDGTFVCGVVEGFYGRPWTTGQRRELFRRMRGMGMNTYLYGPKDDYKHRLYWREPYSADEISLLKLLIDASQEYDILFIYAISPGLDMSFASPKEVECLQNKLLQVQSVGCKAFALLFDDIDPILCAVDKAQYASAAAAQASVTNEMHQVLGEPKFLFCPTEYCSSMAIPDVPNSQYLKTIGDKLNKNISIMWTGPKVVSKHITVESIKQLTRILHRKVVIWDNIHANDYDPKRMFLGPYKGRSTDLIPHLAGVLTNPNCEFESNYIAMHTLASWWKSYLRHKEKSEIEQKETPKFEAEEEEKKSDVEMESEEKKDTAATTKVLEGAESVSEEVGEEKKAEDPEPSPSQQKDGEDTEEGQKVDVEAKGDQVEAAKKDEPAEVPQEQKQTEQPPNSVPDEPPGNSASRMSSGVSSLIDSDGSDADSDYSSHDDYYVLSRHLDAPPFDHGVYDPDASLKEAIQSWLPYFFASNLPHGKPVARSGPALGMLPHFDVALVSNAPMGPMSSTTSALTNDPILSTPLPDFEPEQNKRIRVEFELESEHIVTKQKDTVAEVAGEKQDDTVEKAPDDVEMAGATPVATPPNATPVSGGDDKSDLGDVKMRSDSDIDMNLSPTSSNQEKKKEEEVKELGDSVEIPIKRIDSALRMETEDDEPMQLEPDHDSDVSMATNTSGEEKKVPKDDTEEKEAAASLSESSVDMMTPPHQPSSPNQTSERDENGSPEHSTPSEEERPETRAPPIQFKIEPMTREDVELAVELFYLPYEHGGFGLKMVQEFVWLQNNIRQAVMPPNAPPSVKNESMNKAVEWMEHAIQFENCCALIQRMCNKLISCSNRALLYDLFPYFWDMKGVVSMLSSYVKWMGQFYLRRQPAITPEPSESSPSSSKPASPSLSSNPNPVAITSSQMPPLPPAAIWLGHDPEPWLFRGGLSGEFQRLLPITMANDLFCQVMPCSPPASNTTYTIRPYLASDEKAVYNICLTTGNDGTDFADDFSGYDDLPGERLVGGLLTLSPEYCFVLEDDLGICGYLVGTVDAKSFWKKHEIAFWPEVKEKYSKMKTEEKGETKVGEDLRRLLDEVANEEPLDSYAVDNLYNSHPAYMQIAVHRRVTDPSIAKSMTVCMLSALKSHGIHGVHTTVRSSDCYMPDLYCRLGFRDIRPFEHPPPVPVPQPTCTLNKADTFIVFGRTF